MKIYSYKDLQCGFVILCTESAVNLLKTTANSIKNRYPGIPYICCTDNAVNSDDFKAMKAICPTFKGKDTITSLINVGMKNAPAEWIFFASAGSTVRWKLDLKFSYFIESKKDVCFPISDRKTNFYESTLNGLFINRETWNEVGSMIDKGDLEQIKLAWANSAMKKGVKFKAIIGSQFC